MRGVPVSSEVSTIRQYRLSGASVDGLRADEQKEKDSRLSSEPLNRY